PHHPPLRTDRTPHHCRHPLTPRPARGCRRWFTAAHVDTGGNGASAAGDRLPRRGRTVALDARIEHFPQQWSVGNVLQDHADLLVPPADHRPDPPAAEELTARHKVDRGSPGDPLAAP